MLTKVVRIPLISDNIMDYQKVNKELWNIQSSVRTAKNRTIQLLWEWNNFSHDYHKLNGIYPKTSDMLPLKTFRGNINAYLKNEFTNMYSANLSTSLTAAEQEFNNAMKDVQKGERSIISYKDNMPIDLHNKSIHLFYDEKTNEFSCALNLFSKKRKTELDLPDTTLKFKMILSDKSQHNIISRCFYSNYKISASKLIYVKKKKQWFLNLSYSFESENTVTLDPKNIMGVDLGIACAAVMSFNCSPDKYFISGGEITAFRHRIERQKKELQRQGKYCGEGRIGHGTKTRIKPIERLNEVISNFRNTINHNYSRFIVDKALKHNCGTIQLENLKDIAGDSKFLKEWTYFDLRTKIEYKAKENGINVVAIDPHYTSQRCSRCGYIDKENRPKDEKGQAFFQCLKCGFKDNADYNASQNIATYGIEQIISESANVNQT